MNIFSRQTIRLSFLAIAACVLVPGFSLAGLGRWTSGGPADPNVSAVATDPTDSGVVYAGTRTGLLFRTTDAGRTWQPTSFSGSRVSVIVVDPAAPFTIYVGTDSGVFRTSDAGASWTPINDGLPARAVEALAIDPRNPAVLYVGATGILSVNPTTTASGIWKTVDRGARWQPTGLQGSGVRFVAVDPRTPGVLYAAPYGFPPLSANNGLGIWKSSDGGSTWTRAEGSLGGPPFRAIVVDPVEDSNVYGAWFANAVFKSTDAGGSFQRIDATPDFVQLSALVIDPMTPSTLYLGSERGVFRSTNAGTSWAPFNCGLSQLGITSLAIDSTGRFVHVGTATAGVFGYEVPSVPTESCPGGLTTACLFGARFCVQIDWRTPDGRSGSGVAVPFSDQSAAFWFFDPANIEVVIKVLNGVAVNGRYWVFYGALSNVEYTVRVSDSQTGRTKTYFNPQGRLESVADDQAFPFP